MNAAELLAIAYKGPKVPSTYYDDERDVSCQSPDGERLYKALTHSVKKKEDWKCEFEGKTALEYTKRILCQLHGAGGPSIHEKFEYYKAYEALSDLWEKAGDEEVWAEGKETKGNIYGEDKYIEMSLFQTALEVFVGESASLEQRGKARISYFKLAKKLTKESATAQKVLENFEKEEIESERKTNRDRGPEKDSWGKQRRERENTERKELMKTLKKAYDGDLDAAEKVLEEIDYKEYKWSAIRTLCTGKSRRGDMALLSLKKEEAIKMD